MVYFVKKFLNKICKKSLLLMPSYQQNHQKIFQTNIFVFVDLLERSSYTILLSHLNRYYKKHERNGFKHKSSQWT